MGRAAIHLQLLLATHQSKHENTKRMTSKNTNEKKLIYGVVDYGEGARVVIANRDEAEEIYSALKAAKSHTWGEFRRSCPKKHLDGVLEDILHEDGELPEDDELFSSGRIPGGDYDWPRYASGLYGEGLPEEIVEEYGIRYDTVLDGLMIHFAPEDLASIRRELESWGYEIERNDQTAKHAVGFGELNLG